jgi:hypothetical protein
MQWIDGAADDAARATRNAANLSQSDARAMTNSDNLKCEGGKQLEFNT